MSSANDPLSTQPLAGKVAIVTGAGRNIGQAEALALARAGARVVVNSREHAEGTVERIRSEGGEAVAINCDVSSWAAGEAVVDKALTSFGRIDILINNAGIHRPQRIDTMSEQEWDEVIDVNLKGYAATIRFTAPHFIAQRSGIIVNTGSTSGLGHLGVANYAASKEGVAGLTRTVARDLGEFGIRCNAIRPVSFVTGMATDEMIGISARSRELGFPSNGTRHFVTRADTVPTGEHVAALALLLCLPETAEVSGQDFFIMGDEVGRYPEPELQCTQFHPGGWTIDALRDPRVLDNLLGNVRNRYIRN
jgi:3-oxoacyl-[acyl-carrier protein] reductase